MQRFKLTFRNKSALEQLCLCERTVSAIAASGLSHLDFTQVTDAQATVGALRTSHERVDSLRAELKCELSRRNELLGKARQQVTNASLGLACAVSFEPTKLLAAGLDWKNPRRHRSAFPPCRIISPPRPPPAAPQTASRSK